PTFAL
ncbi:hypothetical protein OXX80_010043, partial [Metschnikowia pulcherrima]